MFGAIRKHINPATILALVALVFAITGGAYAASSSGGSSHGKLTASAAKKKKKKSTPTGKPGPRGSAGPAGKNGTNGAVGPAGPAGPAGPVGPAGKDGVNGNDGASIEGKEGKEGATGKEGPTGKEGATGAAGVIHPGETLPSGASETGTWSVNAGAITGESNWSASISFPIPLKEGKEETTYVFTKAQTENKDFGSSGCLWEESNPESRPAAPAGELCIFTYEEANTHGYSEGVRGPGQFEGYGSAGALVYFYVGTEATSVSPGSLQDSGVWAVTAP